MRAPEASRGVGDGIHVPDRRRRPKTAFRETRSDLVLVEKFARKFAEAR